MTAIRKHLPAVAVALSAGVGAVASSYAVAANPQQLVVSPVEDILRAVVPGDLIFFMIQNFGSGAQQFNYALAVVLSVVAFGGLAAFARAVGHKSGTDGLAIPVAVVSGWLVAAALTAAPLRSVGVGLGTGIVVASSPSPAGTSRCRPCRWTPAAGRSSAAASRR
ncbi:hypothetical protein GJ629_15175, partial [Halapricum sp. CBA1109]|nr:hypothetical protein [Halapricum sp. CBA1109]